MMGIKEGKTRCIQRFVRSVLACNVMMIGVILIIISTPVIASSTDSATPPDGYRPSETIQIVSPQSLMAEQLNVETAENNNADVLLIQTALPWNSNANTRVLSNLGYTYEVTGISDLASHNLSKYQVVLIVNDQVQSFYDQYAANYAKVEDYVQTGGTLVFFACDHGWAGGNNYTDLPGGVQVGDLYDGYNTIDEQATSHPIITGSLRDDETQRAPLTNADLNGTYASHNYFVESTLPANSNVVLRSKSNGAPTLARYQLGKGQVIASGLTWEFTYDRYTADGIQYGFGRALPDVFLYAFAVAGQINPALSVYPDDNRVRLGRPTTWKNPGDILDVVASVQGSRQEEIRNGDAFSLSFSIDSTLVDSTAPVKVYQRADHASIVERQETEVINPVIDWSGEALTITLNDLSLGDKDGEWLVRVKLDDSPQTKQIDAQVKLSVDGSDFSANLADLGPIPVTAYNKIILTNRTALYFQFVSDGNGGRDTAKADEISNLWGAVYKEAGEIQASMIYVDKFDLGFDGENTNAILSWQTDRTNLTFDSDTSTGNEEDSLNGVANRIVTYLSDRVNDSGGIGTGRYVAILGGDSVIPFCRSYDVTGTVLSTAQHFPTHPEFFASTVFRSDGENGYLHTDGCYRAIELPADYKQGIASLVHMGRIAGPSLEEMRSLWESSSRRKSTTENIVMLENHARDDELQEYEIQAVTAGYNMVDSISGTTLDEEPVSCSWWQWLTLNCPNQTDDDALWNPDLQALFTGTGDVADFDIWRGMSHGSVEAIQSSENWYHEYTSGQLLTASTSDIASNFFKFHPLFIFDACLVGQVDGDDSDDLLNTLLGLNVGGAAGSSVVTYSFTPGDISDYNDTATASLFQGNNIGQAYSTAFRGFRLANADKDDLHRQSVNLFGLPWAQVTLSSQAATATLQSLAQEAVAGPVNLAANGTLTRTISFEAANYSVDHDFKTGFEFVTVEGFKPMLENPQTPVLVYRTELLSFPPDVEIVDVRLVPRIIDNLGALNLPGFKRGLGLPGIPLGEFVPLENASGIYPRELVSYGVGDLNNGKALNIVFYPLQFNADSGETTLITEGQLVVEYRTSYKGTGDYLVTDKTSYISGQPIVATVSVTNITAEPASFSLSANLLDWSRNSVDEGENGGIVAAGQTGKISVSLATPTMQGMYKLRSVVTDDAGNEIAVFENDIFVTTGEITKFNAYDSFMQDEQGWFSLGFANYRTETVVLTIDIEVYTLGGDLVSKIPEVWFDAPTMAISEVDIPWIPSPTLPDGKYYASVLVSDEEGQSYTAKSDSFTVGETLNTAPVADAGLDQAPTCTGPQGAEVTLNGGGSYDADGDPLTYIWTGPFGKLGGSVVTVTLPLGIHTITLTVDDGKGGIETDTAVVIVKDTIPPQIDVSVSPDILWPPNHKMVSISATVTASDTCDLNPEVILKSIVMDESDLTNTYDSEYDDTVVDGNTNGDVQEADTGTDDRDFVLRAERSGTGTGRNYVITYSVRDASGNTATASATVNVPHNQ